MREGSPHPSYTEGQEDFVFWLTNIEGTDGATIQSYFLHLDLHVEKRVVG